MKKILILFSLVLTASLHLFADGISMDMVFDSLTSNKVTAGDFVQEKTAAKLKKPIKSSGKFIFSDQGIVWQTLKPFPSTMAVTESKIIQIKPDGSKIVTDGSSNEVFKSVAATLSSLFSGSQASMEKYFTIESFDSTGADWALVLCPKDRTISAALKSIELGGNTVYLRPGDAPKASLNSMKIIQSATESTSYTLSNQVYRQELTDEEKALFR